jgi:hypothetical protein
MLHREIGAIYFQSCTKHINIFCGEKKGEFLNVKTWWYIMYLKGLTEFLMCVNFIDWEPNCSMRDDDRTDGQP